MKRVGQYVLGKPLGKGSYATVRYAEHKETKKPVAIKIIDRSRIDDELILQQMKREISILKRMDHPNVVRLYEVLQSKSKLFLVLEYMNGGDLLELLSSNPHRCLPEADARKIFQQILLALHYCHLNGITHRDLKIENILFNQNKEIKISDFGLSFLHEHTQKERASFSDDNKPIPSQPYPQSSIVSRISDGYIDDSNIFKPISARGISDLSYSDNPKNEEGHDNEEVVEMLFSPVEPLTGIRILESPDIMDHLGLPGQKNNVGKSPSTLLSVDKNKRNANFLVPPSFISAVSSKNSDGIDFLLSTTCGTPQYLAPEIILGEKHYDGRISDIWSCGVILYALVAGTLPFNDDDAADLFRAISLGSLGVDWHKNISPQLKSLLQGIFEIDPSKRYTIADIASHPWCNADAESKKAFQQIVEQGNSRSNRKHNIEYIASPSIQSKLTNLVGDTSSSGENSIHNFLSSSTSSYISVGDDSGQPFLLDWPAAHYSVGGRAQDDNGSVEHRRLDTFKYSVYNTKGCMCCGRDSIYKRSINEEKEILSPRRCTSDPSNIDDLQSHMLYHRMKYCKHSTTCLPYTWREERKGLSSKTLVDMDDDMKARHIKTIKLLVKEKRISFHPSLHHLGEDYVEEGHGEETSDQFKSGLSSPNFAEKHRIVKMNSILSSHSECAPMARMERVKGEGGGADTYPPVRVLHRKRYCGRRAFNEDLTQKINVFDMMNIFLSLKINHIVNNGCVGKGAKHSAGPEMKEAVEEKKKEEPMEKGEFFFRRVGKDIFTNAPFRSLVNEIEKLVTGNFDCRLAPSTRRKNKIKIIDGTYGHVCSVQIISIISSLRMISISCSKQPKHSPVDIAHSIREYLFQSIGEKSFEGSPSTK